MGCSGSKQKGKSHQSSDHESGESALYLGEEEIAEGSEEHVGGIESGESYKESVKSGTEKEGLEKSGEGSEDAEKEEDEDELAKAEADGKLNTTESGENAPQRSTPVNKAYRGAPNVLDNDKFVQFVQEGGSISDLIEMHPPPDGWNENLLRKYPVGCTEVLTDNERVEYQGIIHVNDEDMYTKRHFLAFYNVSVHTMYPTDFIRWCRDHSMHNTIADYIGLYQASRFHGPGSTSLKGLAKDPNALGIEMSDRFVTPYGVFRAIVFRACSLFDVRRIANAYIRRLLPSAYRSVRCYFPEEQLD
ncbi:unnamed protein product [Calicophoron daubneyi]|uniref:Uncharacterized protein n=1 Tax=Calicophoron daubneyi TaxID=300641 RepID=A0AAV2T5X6_CALDB